MCCCTDNSVHCKYCASSVLPWSCNSQLCSVQHAYPTARSRTISARASSVDVVVEWRQLAAICVNVYVQVRDAEIADKVIAVR